MMKTYQSKIEKLLDGSEIEWLPLGDIGEFIRGNGLQKKDFVEVGYPAIHYGQIHTRYGLSAKKTFTYISKELFQKLRKAQNNDLLLATTSENDEDVVKPLAWLGNKVAISGDMILFRHEQNVKYLAYFLQTEAFQAQKRKYITGAKVRRVSGNDLAKISVPIPCPDDPKKSLAIQSEIVRILDTFIELTAELTIELTIELTARKKQYSYYRDKLLTFEGSEVEWQSLKNLVLRIFSGGTPKTDISEYWKNGTIPWMSSGEVNLETVYKTEKYISESGLKNSSAKYVPANSVVIALAGQGKTRGKVARTRIKLTTNQSLAAIIIDQSKVKSDYIFHFLKTRYEHLRQISSGNSGRGGLNLQMISSYEIPIPYPDDPEKSLAEQARIVRILNKFDTLTHSISEGLPREIALRQKQYEYYRDLLLNFPKPEEVTA